MRYAFITPRYGAEIDSGVEHVCRLLAEQVCKRHDVDVWTTTARHRGAWRNEYGEGSDRVRGVLVRRFAVSSVHDATALDAVARRLHGGPRSRPDELEWVRQAGPSSADLVEHIRRHHRSYDALVFFGLWHPLTVDGVGIAAGRSILFPHVQLGQQLRFDLWAEVLTTPRALGYVSHAERALVHRYVGVAPGIEEVIGLGVTAPPPQSYPRHQQDPADAITPDDTDGDSETEEEDGGYLAGRGVLFKRRQRLYGAFALFGGRAAPDNGSEEMLEYFDAAAATDDLMLVLMGPKLFKVPDAPYLRLAGVLTAGDRMAAFEAATLTLAPAPDDLAAQSVLESFAVGTPVLANARNTAAVEHCRRSNAGLYYAGRDEFVGALQTLTRTPHLLQRMGENGRRYVRQQYQWDAVIGRFERLVAALREK